MKWQCKLCPYVYDTQIGDPDNGIPPGTPLEELNRPGFVGGSAPSARWALSSSSRSTRMWPALG